MSRQDPIRISPCVPPVYPLVMLDASGFIPLVTGQTSHRFRTTVQQPLTIFPMFSSQRPHFKKHLC